MRPSLSSIQHHRRRPGMSWADLATLKSRGFTYSVAGPAPAVPEASPSSAGFRADLGFAVQSSWEANWVRYLQWLKAHGKLYDWTYHPGEFVFPVGRGQGSFYRPDFEVWPTPGQFYFQETKGYLDTLSATKLKRMQKYYPCFPVELIQANKYYAIARQVGRLIPHWEGVCR